MAEVLFEKNKDRIKAYVKIWQIKNWDKVCEYSKKRQAANKQAKPKWLTQDQIRTIESKYFCARSLTKATGVRFEVDHIVPVQGKTVCGLTVPWNLKVITATQNRIKGYTIWH